MSESPSIPEKPLRAVTVDMRCGCGAALFVEWPLQSGYVGQVTEIAQAFIGAHAGCCAGKATK